MTKDKLEDTYNDEACTCDYEIEYDCDCEHKLSLPIKIGIGVAAVAAIGSVVTLMILKNKKSKND